MGIKIGNIDVSYLKVGDSDCSIYLGDTLMYSGGTTPPVPPTPTFEGKYKLTLSDSSVVTGECDASSAVTSGEVSTQYSGTVVSAEIGDCVKTIQRAAFKGCSALTSCELGNEITTINDEAFSGCTNLSSLTIPESVTSIGKFAFSHCRSLSNINIPSGVTSIEMEVFCLCESFVNVNIPSSVTSIKQGAFYICSSLSSVTIPDSVTNIGRLAFGYCSGLTSVTVEATTPPTLGSEVFSSTNNCPIYVPAESVEVYKSASGWSTYASRIQAIPSS